MKREHDEDPLFSPNSEKQACVVNFTNSAQECVQKNAQSVLLSCTPLIPLSFALPGDLIVSLEKNRTLSAAAWRALAAAAQLLSESEWSVLVRAHSPNPSPKGRHPVGAPPRLRARPLSTHIPRHHKERLEKVVVYLRAQEPEVRRERIIADANVGRPLPLPIGPRDLSISELFRILLVDAFASPSAEAVLSVLLKC